MSISPRCSGLGSPKLELHIKPAVVVDINIKSAVHALRGNAEEWCCFTGDGRLTCPSHGGEFLFVWISFCPLKRKEQITNSTLQHI